MSSMNFGNNDQWHMYQRQIEESRENEDHNREAEDPLYQLRKEDPSFAFSAALIGIMRERVSDKWHDLFRRLDSSMLNLATKQAFSELRLLLVELEQRDVSMEVGYLVQLSKVWILVEQAVKGLQEHPNAATLAIRGYIFELFEEIAACKKGQEFPLIHYLKEHAGSSWVPFPYMHILRTLHEDFHNNLPENSLARWLKMIDAILERTGGIDEDETIFYP